MILRRALLRLRDCVARRRHAIEAVLKQKFHFPRDADFVPITLDAADSPCAECRGVTNAEASAAGGREEGVALWTLSVIRKAEVEADHTKVDSGTISPRHLLVFEAPLPSPRIAPFSAANPLLNLGTLTFDCFYLHCRCFGAPARLPLGFTPSIESTERCLGVSLSAPSISCSKQSSITSNRVSACISMLLGIALKCMRLKSQRWSSL